MKGDLNLLSIKKSAVSKELIVVILLLGTAVILTVGYFFAFIPNNKKSEVLNTIRNKEEEIKKYEGLENQIDLLSVERDELNELVASMEVVGNAKVLLSEVLVNIDNAVPVGVLLGSMEYGENQMIFGGRTRGLVRISQFLVKLRQMDDVIAVKLHDVEYIDPDELNDNPEEDNIVINEEGLENLEENYIYENMPYYEFKITIIYNFNKLSIDENGGGE